MNTCLAILCGILVIQVLFVFQSAAKPVSFQDDYEDVESGHQSISQSVAAGFDDQDNDGHVDGDAETFDYEDEFYFMEDFDDAEQPPLAPTFEASSTLQTDSTAVVGLSQPSEVAIVAGEAQPSESRTIDETLATTILPQTGVATELDSSQTSSVISEQTQEASLQYGLTYISYANLLENEKCLRLAVAFERAYGRPVSGEYDGKICKLDGLGETVGYYLDPQFPRWVQSLKSNEGRSTFEMKIEQTYSSVTLRCGDGNELLIDRTTPVDALANFNCRGFSVVPDDSIPVLAPGSNADPNVFFLSRHAFRILGNDGTLIATNRVEFVNFYGLQRTRITSGSLVFDFDPTFMVLFSKNSSHSRAVYLSDFSTGFKGHSLAIWDTPPE